MLVVNQNVDTTIHTSTIAIASSYSPFASLPSADAMMMQYCTDIFQGSFKRRELTRGA